METLELINAIFATATVVLLALAVGCCILAAADIDRAAEVTIWSFAGIAVSLALWGAAYSIAWIWGAGG